MRILLTSTASFVPPRGGSTRSNRVWLEHLASRGHHCRVVCAAAPADTPDQMARVVSEAASQGLLIDPARDHQETVTASGIRISIHRRLGRQAGLLAAEIAAFQPDWVLVSSEDLGHSLLREADEAAPGRIVYLAHTPQFLPFGPESWNPDAQAARRVTHAAAVIAIGTHMAAYIRRHSGVEARVIHPPVYGPGPFENIARWNEGFALIVNPCAVKGIGIFLELARVLPSVPFAALPGWGTTPEDRARLEALPNVRLLQPVRRIEEVLEQTRVLLMPSLWHEGFGLIVMEAMLRGIPVIASNSGGLPEAKHSREFVLPVSPIREYLAEFDEVHMPRPVVPAQDVQSWVTALETLLNDRAVYERESERSFESARDFVYAINPAAIEALLLSLRPAPSRLKILLAHNSLYFPSHGGGDKSNRLLMEALADRGHAVEVLSRLENFNPAEEQRFLAELDARQTPVESVSDGVVRFHRNGVTVYTLAGSPHLRSAFSSRVEEFQPDIIICSTDDPGGLLLEVALRYPRARVVYLVRATVAVPFGPDAASPNPAKTAMIGRVDSIIGVSEYVAAYVRQWSGFPALHVPISLLEPGDYSDMGGFENEFVLMVNPCAVKGISIFTALAEAMPHVAFAAVPTWGTNPEDLALLAKYDNIKLFAPVDDMAILLRRTRIVLVPSVWAEARSRMVVESMIRGIPVIASDVGGLHEAKLGVEYLLPVNPIQRYHARVDTNMVPMAEVPPQDIQPWKDALQRLLSDRAHYEDVARRSRAAALAYADTLHAGWLEDHLETLIQLPNRDRKGAAAKSHPIASLSPAKRQLLSLRLARAKAANARLRLYCFPPAGGNAVQSWHKSLAPEIDAQLIRLPDDPPFTEMRALIHALMESIAPRLKTPFAFYGHSMGAGVSFELIRALRRNGRPLPVKLIVSSARAPQLRTAAPDSTEDEILPEVEAMFPTLRADAYLYRHYIYEPDAPLDIPIEAHLGIDDPSLKPEHMQAWGEQTTAGFSFTLHPGGHFFMRGDEAGWIESLRRALLI